MEWLDGIFDQSSSSKHGGHNQGYNLPTQSSDEELDHAVALSLYEDYHRKAKGHYADEDLARALQESLSFHVASSQANSMPAYQVASRVCGGCKRPIGSARFLNCAGAFWHSHCFRCHACNALITDQNFSTWGNHPYHKACYKRLSLPKCDVCKNYVPVNSAGMIEYRSHPFWKQKYCPRHETDRVPQCCGCERMESTDIQYISLSDERKLCFECLNTAIMDTGECQPLYHEIRDFYEGLNMKIQQQIPMLLVERQALNEAKVGEKGQHNMPETRGLCLSEERTVNTITRRPRMGAGNRLVDMRTGSMRLTRHCEVTAILVLYGLPRLLTGSILAHELMHAWLRLNGFRNLKLEVEEGICQVMAHMWLESEVMAGSSRSSGSSLSSMKSKAPRTAMEKKLGEFFLQQIANDTSPIYGKGFQRGHASMARYGLRRTLDHIKMTGGFPL